MPDFIDFLPLYPEEDEVTIRARWVAWSNEGLDPVDDVESWTDTRTGSFWDVTTMPAIRENARIYDLMGTEVPASALAAWSWGDYLTGIAAIFDVIRLPPTSATGEETFTGLDGTPIPAGTTVAAPPSTPDADAVEFQTEVSGVIGDVTPGILTVPIRALADGVGGNLAADAVTEPVTPIPDVTSLTNVNPTVGGTEPESDLALRIRLLERFSGSAVANILYYRRLALNHPGVGRVTVIPAASGPGTITIVVSTADGSPVSSDVIDSLQEQLDPAPGQGAGDGQVGATITVLTTTTQTIDVVATLDLLPGYSIDGVGGTVAVRDAIETALTAYIATVQPGEKVVYNQVIARIADVNGVHDVTALTVNGGTANVTISAAPPKVPVLNVLTLT